jgi:putative flavoprotein involved in K+ transport
LTWWFGALGLFDMTAEQRGPIRINPSITGAYGGYTIDFRRFAADGITLLGRVSAARDGVLDIAPGLAESIANGDIYYATFLGMLDAHVERRGLHLPDDPAARAVLPDPPCLTEPIRRLDLGRSDIHAVIWATGYDVDFSWIDLPVRNGSGEPVHRGGITDEPGLYFLGLPYLSKLYSAFLSGVGDDAAVLADHIAARR